MFGDVGHGLMMFAFALLLCAFFKKIPKQEDESVNMILNARWMLLAMSIFSIYRGALYNEMFAVGMNLFGTQWSAPPNPQLNATLPNPCLAPPGNLADPVPPGCDGRWWSPDVKRWS